jgi:serine/alanine adding enzyme
MLATVTPDQETWDQFVQRHPAGHLLQLSGWGELKRRVGWEPRRLVVTAGDGAPFVAGAQVLLRRRFGLAAAYVPRGPLLSGDQQADELLLDALERLARRARSVFLRLEPNLLETDPASVALAGALQRRGFIPAAPIQPRSTIHLDLAAPPERLLAQMSKGHRADIRRAAREGVTVRRGTAPADLDAFYAIMQQTGSRADFAIHSRSYYRDAWELFGERALLLLAEREGRVVAACLVFAAAVAGLYLYGGSTDEGLRAGANHALQWEALQWARERGSARYDFWGIPDAIGQALGAADETERARLEAEAQRDPLIGVYRFKKGFGGAVARYMPAYDRRYIAPLYELWRRRTAM